MNKIKLSCYALTACLIFEGLIFSPHCASLLHARSSADSELIYITPMREVMLEESILPVRTLMPIETSRPIRTIEPMETLRPIRTIEPMETLNPIKTITPVKTMSPPTPTPTTPKPTPTTPTPTTPTPTPATPKTTPTPPILKPTLELTSTPTSIKLITPTPTKTQLVTLPPATPTGSTPTIVTTPKVTEVDIPTNTNEVPNSNPDNSQEVIDTPEEIPNSIQQIVQRFYIGVKYYYINNVKNEMDTAPIIKDGRTLLPIRYVSETFGAKVDWDGKEEKVSISFGEKRVELWIGKDAAIVDGTLKRLDVAPEIIEGRTVLPLRFVSENLGLKVEWDQDLREIKLTN